MGANGAIKSPQCSHLCPNGVVISFPEGRQNGA
jgi:hypothetical protein